MTDVAILLLLELNTSLISFVVHKYKIENRRRRVASLLAQSMTETEIAKKLKVDQSTISRDIKVLKKLSQQLDNYPL